MEKSLEIHLQEERERIARIIEENILWTLQHQPKSSEPIELVARAHQAAMIANGVRNNFKFDIDKYLEEQRTPRYK